MEDIIHLTNQGKHHEAWELLKDVEVNDIKNTRMYICKYLESYYVGKKDIGRSIFDDICKLGTDTDTYNLLMNNYNWYTIIVPGKVIKLDPTKIGNLVPMNISLVKYNGIIHIFHRYINYVINESNGYYIYVDDGRVISTVNCVEVLDNEYQICKRTVINTVIPQSYKSISVGLEDGRIFLHNGEMYVSGTCWGVNDVMNAGQITLAKVVGDELVDIMPVNFGKGSVQKNWLPINDDVNKKVYGTNTFKWIYGWSPFTIIEMNESNDVKVIYEHNVPMLSRTKGSSGPIEYENGYLTLVHENNNSAPRLYYHRFVYHDENLKPVKASRMFKLQDKKMEFISGMVMDGDKLIIGFSLLDKDSSLFIFDANEIKDMLYDL